MKAKDIAQYSKQSSKIGEEYKSVSDLDVRQMTLFDAAPDNDILDDLRNLDITNMTPIDALNELYKLQGKLKNRW